MARSHAARQQRTRECKAASLALLTSWFQHELPDWTKIWSDCWQHIRKWRRPPHWSGFDWYEESLAQGAAAAWQAISDYDPARCVPLGAFVHQRILARVRTRYRQEWVYAIHLSPEALVEGCESKANAFYSAADGHVAVEGPLSGLVERDRYLIVQLYWSGLTEAEVGENLGISQQAVSKRKREILLSLRRSLSTVSTFEQESVIPRL